MIMMNKYKAIITVLLLNTTLLMSQKYETQEYKTVSQIDNIEIRYYPSAAMIKVSADLNRNNNFGKLFRYISGNNKSEEKIAMTTPVYMSNDSKTMEFVLPKKYISSELPIPNDENLETYISEPKYFAAIKYSGYSNQRKEIDFKNKLIKIIKNNNFEMLSDYYVLSYDSPAKFYNRRNEILIEINYKN